MLNMVVAKIVHVEVETVPKPKFVTDDQSGHDDFDDGGDTELLKNVRSHNKKNTNVNNNKTKKLDETETNTFNDYKDDDEITSSASESSELTVKPLIGKKSQKKTKKFFSGRKNTPANKND